MHSSQMPQRMSCLLISTEKKCRASSHDIEQFLLLCRFLDAGNNETRRTPAGRRPKSAKARSRGKLGTGWQRVLWGFHVGADLDCGRDARTTPAACLHAREAGRVQ